MFISIQTRSILVLAVSAYLADVINKFYLQKCEKVREIVSDNEF